MAVASSLWAVAAPATVAQAAVRAEAGLVAGLTSTGINPVTLTSRIELHASEDPGWGSGGFQWHVAANPTLPLTPSAGPSPTPRPPTFEWALEEVYLAVRRGGWMLSAGQQRLPLEVARLSLPFYVEPVAPGDLRLGLWGIRLVHQSGTTRLRLAAVDYQGRLTPAASWRWQGRQVVFEAHALAEGADPPRAVAGLTASGLVRQLVAYGEVWRGLEWHYVGGLSGLWGESLWTVEAGRASPAPGQPARRLVGAQLAWRQDEEVAWAVTQYVFLDEDSLPGQLALERTWAAGPLEVRLFAATSLGREAPQWWLAALTDTSGVRAARRERRLLARPAAGSHPGGLPVAGSNRSSKITVAQDSTTKTNRLVCRKAQPLRRVHRHLELAASGLWRRRGADHGRSQP